MFGRPSTSNAGGPPELKQSKLTSIKGRKLGISTDSSASKQRPPTFGSKAARRATASAKRATKNLPAAQTSAPARFDRLFTALRMTEGERTRYWRYLQVLGTDKTKQPEFNESVLKLLEQGRWPVPTSESRKRNNTAISRHTYQQTIVVNTADKRPKTGKDIITIAVPVTSCKDEESVARFLLYKLYLVARLLYTQAQEAVSALQTTPQQCPLLFVKTCGGSHLFDTMRRIVETSSDTEDVIHLLYGYHCVFLWT